MPATKTAIEHSTKNDLPQSIREPMIDKLQASLASAVDLAIQAKLAHWNVKGPSFIALHELFDKAADEAREWADGLAERLVQLGGVAEGSVQKAAENTALSGYPLDISTGHDHVEAFASALAAFGEHVRANISSTADAGDEGTADLYTEISRGVDKLLWFVEAHNQ